MTEESQPTPSEQNKPGWRQRLRAWLARPTQMSMKALIVLFIAGGVFGILFWGGFNWGIEETNSLQFCTACHEMRDNPYPEYQKSIHYSNQFGVRAICPDCHVPHAWTPKMIRKAKASMELWGKITGKIDTPEKFEAHRMELATKEWARMKANNSRECRNCHSYDAMNKEAQGQTKYSKHMKAQADNQACIDCHKGIAHRLPKEYHDPSEDE